MKNLFLAIGALVLISAQLSADVVSKSAEVTGKVVVEVAGKIAAGQIIDEAAAVAALGKQGPLGASLFAAIATMKANGKLSGDTSKLLDQIAGGAAKVDAQTMVGKFAEVAASGKSFTHGNVASVFNLTAVNLPAPRSSSQAANRIDALTVFTQYVPKSEATRAIHRDLLADTSRAGLAYLTTIANLLGYAMYRFPQTCSTGAKNECGLVAPEVVLLWAGQGYHQLGDAATNFMRGILDAFKGQKDSFVGKGELIILGAKRNLLLGRERMPRELRFCFETGQMAL